MLSAKEEDDKNPAVQQTTVVLASQDGVPRLLVQEHQQQIRQTHTHRTTLANVGLRPTQLSRTLAAASLAPKAIIKDPPPPKCFHSSNTHLSGALFYALLHFIILWSAFPKVQYSFHFL